MYLGPCVIEKWNQAYEIRAKFEKVRTAFKKMRNIPCNMNPYNYVLRFHNPAYES